jgi:PAS domain S-box-containing protein
MRDEDLLEESAEDLYENAPCGYLSCGLDGTILRVNRTLADLLGRPREDLVGRRFAELLAPGARIYHETHYAPLLRLHGSVKEIALELVRGDGSRLPALVNSVQRTDEQGRPRIVRTTVFDASDRRSYEQELLRSQRREQEVARHLQRSLLSGELPAGPDVGVAVVYRPAVQGLDVGGDWYDAFWLEPGRRVGLVVGDVVGRGIEAAAEMGQLRSAVRALALTGLGPGALLGALDAFAARHDVGRMATVAYAELEVGGGGRADAAPGVGGLRLACAGHPPPLLLAPGDDPVLVWDGRSPPLDAGARAGPRPEGARTLDPGSTLLLYTDGLVERRARSLSVGLDHLVAEVAARRLLPLEALLASVTRRLDEPAHRDDVCLLGVRLGAVPAAPG